MASMLSISRRRRAPCFRLAADTVDRQRRIYLDHAATTWPKRQEAVFAAQQFIESCGATSGRGAYASARAADQHISQARHNLARLLGGRDASDVAFCSSGTHALNAALFGLLRPSDHVVTTAIEHNSVLRPLEHLRRSRGVNVSIAPCNAVGLADMDAARNLINSQTKAIVISHASNVTGCMQNLQRWSELAHKCGAWLIVDASQTVGYFPINVQSPAIDVLAAAGHKGLGALAGTGFLMATPQIQKQLEPLLFGGTGTASEQFDFVPSWPQSVEAGNLNLPAIVSMATAADYWLREGEAGLQSWRRPLAHCVTGLRERFSESQLRLLGHGESHPADASRPWLPIVSLDLKKWDIHEAAAVLDSTFGIEARAGFHCAALIHDALGTKANGGTLRLSFGHDTSLVDIDDLLHALAAML